MKIKLKHLLIGCFIAAGLLIGVFSHQSDGKLHLVFCDVGQGDAIYIKTPKGSDILIDSGPNEKVLNCLSKHMPFYDREIEMVILTHPHADHLTGLISVLDRFQVDKIILENIYVDNNIFKSFRDKVISQNIEIYNPKEGDKIVVDGVEFTSLWPEKVIGDIGLWNKNLGNKQISKYANSQINKQISNKQIGKDECDEDCERVLGVSTVKSDLNQLSLVFLVKSNGFRALLTGDAGEETLSNISKLKEGLGDFDFAAHGLDVLKIPHHGSKTSLSTALLDQLKPKTAVISVGHNSFGHPAESILKILRDKDIKIQRTDRDGEVEITN